MRMIEVVKKGVRKPFEDRRGDVPFWVIVVIAGLVIAAAVIKVAIDQMNGISHSSATATGDLNTELKNASSL